MDLADQALAARRLGDHSSAELLFRQALEHERGAAELVADDGAVEPTRSVLFRSAATLALDCGEVREAERLVATALTGNPPFEIAEELRDLLEQVNFHRHLQLRGIALEPTEFQLTLAGGAVGFGIVPSAEFVERVQNTARLIYRTAERKRGLPFRERGPGRQSIQDDFDLFISVPRAASFAVSFRLGRPISQLRLPDMQDTSEVIDELLGCLELLCKPREDELRRRIGEEAYYRNFISLARKIAPDGERVQLVGFTALRDGKQHRVTLTADSNRTDVSEQVWGVQGPGERVSITGELRYADARGISQGKIRIIDRKGAAHVVAVPEGMMADIVKPLWEDEVVVTGTKVGKRILLEDIRRAP
jgi:hypothetical protein